MESKGGEETKAVETVDYRTPAGGETKKEDIEVIHKNQDGEKPAGGSVFGDAAATVENTFQSVKDVISGIGKEKTPTEEGVEETKVVETVDYRTPAGGETKKEDVEVIHKNQDGEKPSVFANSLQSAKDAISGIGKERTPTEDKTKV